MAFASRELAGKHLGKWLRQQEVVADIVLGLPRGGVVVAAEVARTLQRPLNVLVVRKIGHPQFPEFAVGAMAEPDVVIWDSESIEKKVNPSLLEEVAEKEKLRLHELRKLFHAASAPDLSGRAVLLVDDGLATGATTEAAVAGARKLGAQSVIVSAPVASVSAVERLRRVADDVKVPLVDREFMAVGQYYEDFPQTTDEEVSALLKTFA